MLPVAPKKILRDLVIGFGIGLVLMLGFTYGASTFAGSPPAARMVEKSIDWPIAIGSAPAQVSLMGIGAPHEVAAVRAQSVSQATLQQKGSIVHVAEQRSSSELEGKSGGYGFTARLPLNDIKPGLYVVHVEAQSRAGSQPMVSRDIQIRVK